MRKQKELEIKISSLEFIVTPIKISGKHLQDEKYFIEFDKGAQVLKKFDEEVILRAGRKDYEFTGKEKGKFKLQSQRNSTCEWAIYRFQGDQMSEFVDSLPTNLHECFVKYSESIKRRSVEYQLIISEKSQAREIWRQWEVLKEGLSWEFASLTAKNKANDIEIIFKVEIRCQLDVMSEQERKKSSVKSLKSFVQQDKNNKKEFQDADDLISKNMKPIEEIFKPRVAQQQSITQQKKFDGYRISQSPPFIEPSARKQQSVLSDIIERSNQCSSRNKQSKKGQLKDMTDIPEEQSQLHSPFTSLPNTKTQHFDAKFQRAESVAFKKRSNTFDSNKNISLEEQEISVTTDNKKNSILQPLLSYDQQLQREQLGELLDSIPIYQTSPPQNQVVQQQITEQPKKSGNLKGFIAVIILIIVISFATFSQRSLLLPSEVPKAKKQKVKKEEVRKKPKKQNKEK